MAKLYLALGRVHVDVQLFGRQRDAQDGQRVPVAGQQRVVGLLDGKGQAAVAHPTAIDKERDVLAVAAMQRWLADIARNSNLLRRARLAF